MSSVYYSVSCKRKKSIDVWILLFIVMEIIHPMFGTLSVSGMFVFLVRMGLMAVSILTLLFNFNKEMLKKPLSILLLWMVYVVIKNLIMGYGIWTSPFQMVAAIVPSCLVVPAAIYAYQIDEDKTINAIVVALYIYILYAFFSFGAGVTGGEDSERLGGESLNANTIGIRGSLIFFFVLLKYLKNKINLFYTIILLSVPTLVIFLSGSRTGLGIAFICLLIFVLRGSFGFYTYLGRIVFIGLLYFGAQLAIEYTELGQRLIETSTQVERYSYIETGTAWDLIGDRGYIYYTAIPYIPQYFWFGIGSGNYLYKIPNAIWVLHSEYLIQLLECGIIATLMYYYIYYWIISRTRKLKRNDTMGKNIKRMCLLGAVALLFAGFVTRVSYYGMYSCIIGYLIYNVYNNKNIENENIIL